MLPRTDINLVLVDFDDTLVDTAPRFQNARRELFYLLERAGFEEASARRVHHDQVDPLMRQRFGLGPSRMEHAFRATYEELCAACGRMIDDDVAERATLLGRAVAGTPPVINGALDALARLARVLPTALYTQAGDRSYQLRCIEDCGILDILPLERVCICECKSDEEFRHTLAHFSIDDPATIWMIGNSMRSDINPALLAGANAILVEVADPWEFDLVDPISDAFYRVSTFDDAVNLLLPVGESKCK